MGLLESMDGKSVYIDSAPFIYLIEKNPRYGKLLDPFFAKLDHGKFEALTSTLTITEVLTKPYRLKQWFLAERYKSILAGTPHLFLQRVEKEIACSAAKLRADCSLLTPDAIHWATASYLQADFFLTNDRDFDSIDRQNTPLPVLVFVDDL